MFLKKNNGSRFLSSVQTVIGNYILENQIAALRWVAPVSRFSFHLEKDLVCGGCRVRLSLRGSGPTVRSHGRGTGPLQATAELRAGGPVPPRTGAASARRARGASPASSPASRPKRGTARTSARAPAAASRSRLFTGHPCRFF